MQRQHSLFLVGQGCAHRARVSFMALRAQFGRGQAEGELAGVLVGCRKFCAEARGLRSTVFDLFAQAFDAPLLFALFFLQIMHTTAEFVRSLFAGVIALLHACSPQLIHFLGQARQLFVLLDMEKLHVVHGLACASEVVPCIAQIALFHFEAAVAGFQLPRALQQASGAQCLARHRQRGFAAQDFAINRQHAPRVVVQARKFRNARTPQFQQLGLFENFAEDCGEVWRAFREESRARAADALRERAAVWHDGRQSQLECFVQHERPRFAATRSDHRQIQRNLGEVCGRVRPVPSDGEPFGQLFKVLTL